MEPEIVADVVEIPPSLIDRPAQARKVFEEIPELAASIKAYGQETAGKVRPQPGNRFELVIGERRLRACELAGVSFRCTVVELTDAEADAARVRENTQRVDLQPIERAQAAKAGMAAHGWSAADWALRIGMTERAVRQDLALLELLPALRRMLDGGTIPPNGALAIAGTPRAVQKVIADRFAAIAQSGKRVSLVEVQRVVQEVKRDLSTAPWDRTDATLVPKAGACTVCPKRTGTQGALFDIAETDSCLDGECFDVHLGALWLRKSAEWKARGMLVLDGEKANAALMTDSDYVRLDAIAYYVDARGKATHEERTFKNDGTAVDHEPVMWRQLHDADPVIARDARTGIGVELGPRATLASKLSTILPKARTSVDGHERGSPDKKAARAKEKARAAGLDAAMAATLEWFGSDAASPLFPDIMRALVADEIGWQGAGVLAAVLGAFRWSREDAATGAVDDEKEAARKLLSTLEGRDVAKMHVAFALARSRLAYEQSVPSAAFGTVAKIAGVDPKHYIRQAERELRGVAEPKKRSKKSKMVQTEIPADAE